MVEDWLQRGLGFHRSGQLDSAKFAYDQALIIAPRHPDALHLRGLIALQSGDPALAVEYIRKAAQLQPKNPLFKGNLAAALMEQGAIAEALAAFRRAAQLKPDEAQYQMGVANCLALSGALVQAEKQLRALTQRYPQLALAWFNLANAIRDQGRARDAVDVYKHAIAVDATLVEAHVNLGGTLLSLGQMADAEVEFRRALDLAPADPRIYCNLASAMIDGGRFAEAEATCRQALAVAPDFPLALSFIAAAIGHQGRLIEALDFHRKAASLEPQNARVQTAYGAALCEAGNVDDGILLLERAVALAPQFWEAHFSLSIARLSAGTFESGWREFLHRPTRARFQRLYPDIPLADSLPFELQGKHIAIHREQGLGDQLFFLRFAVEAKARGARLTYRPTGKIASMLARVPAIDRVIDEAERLPPADFTLLVSDLPTALAHARPAASAGDTTQQIPPPLQLSPLDAQMAQIGEQLRRAGPPPYIGLTWRGGTPPGEQTSTAWMLFKEIPIAQFGEALRAFDATLIALQRNPSAGEIEQLSRAAGKPVHDFSALNDDLEAMLALLAQINDYIGVSNTNMHLRAGVGRASRVLVPCPPEWRWMAKGRQSPWFPGCTIYRQKINGEWSEALALLASDLFTTLPATAAD
jgi:tetratricopeptide (TPR) repeat protein